jgi:hypothetical protein
MSAPYAVHVTADVPFDASNPSMFDGMWTIPNAFKLVRLHCLPRFLYG